MKVIVAGPFSDRGGGATAGDLFAAELVCDWLDEAGYSYDIAVTPPLQGGKHLRTCDPREYSHAFAVCGPFSRRLGGDAFFSRFASCRTVGINLSMVDPIEQWNPFDILIERDSSVRARPDVVFLSRRALVPVVGVCLVESYGTAFEKLAYSAIQRLVDSREIAVVEIDTRLDKKNKMFRTPSEVESALARMDVVITTRLHGMVLALKNGVPAISIDPDPSLLKVKRQAETVGWPVVFVANAISDQQLQEAFDHCLTDEAKVEARECSERAFQMAKEIRQEFMKEMAHPNFPFPPKQPLLAKTRRISSGIKRVLAWDGTDFEKGGASVFLNRVKAYFGSIWAERHG